MALGLASCIGSPTSIAASSISLYESESGGGTGGTGGATTIITGNVVSGTTSWSGRGPNSGSSSSESSTGGRAAIEVTVRLKTRNRLKIHFGLLGNKRIWRKNSRQLRDAVSAGKEAANLTQVRSTLQITDIAQI
jgi:hypothetical protein